VEIQNSSVTSLNKIRYPGATDQPPAAKRQQLSESENSENRMSILSSIAMEQRDTLLVEAICNLSRHILQSKQSDISYVEKVLAEVSSVDPRIGRLHKRAQQEKAKQLNHTGVMLKNQALSLSGYARQQKLKEAQANLVASLVIEPRSADALFILGVVLGLQASSLSGKAQHQKLKEAQKKLVASLKINPRNADVLFILGVVLSLQARSLSGKAQHQKLKEAQKKLVASLNVRPIAESAFILFSLGDVLKLQACSLSGKAQQRKLREAQKKLVASLVIEPNNASALRSLGEVLKTKASQIESEETSTRGKGPIGKERNGFGDHIRTHTSHHHNYIKNY